MTDRVERLTRLNELGDEEAQSELRRQLFRRGANLDWDFIALLGSFACSRNTGSRAAAVTLLTRPAMQRPCARF